VSKLYSIKCPNCSAPLAIIGGGRVQTITCAYCKSVIDLNDNYKILSQFKNVIDPQVPFKIGMRGKIENVEWTIIGWIVYKIRVSLIENANFRVANETFEKSNLYVENQKEAKSEMERIDAHIVAIIPIIENYRVLLDEQNAKLQRVLHIEGIKKDSSEYHSSSIDTMKETDLLMERVEALVLTPITKDGKLNDDSVSALHEAKSVSDYFVSKIYA